MSNSPPFPAFPASERFSPVGDIQPSLMRLCRSIDSFEPLSAVFGSAGVGKTLLSKLLEQQYEKTHRVVTILDGSLQGSADLLQYLVHGFGRKTEGRDETSLRLELRDCLLDPKLDPRMVLLIVDNAQRLSETAFEAIRSVTDLMIGDRPSVQAILLGTQKLEERLIGSCSESVTQRIATRCYLHPLTENATREYIHQTINHFGSNPTETISDAAIASIYHSTNGIPRLINQLMTESIDFAAEVDQNQIDEKIVQSSWARLQQLPDPHERHTEQPFKTEIEFGELSEFGDHLEFGELSELDQPSASANDSHTDTPSSAKRPSMLSEASTEKNKPVPSLSFDDEPLTLKNAPISKLENQDADGYKNGTGLPKAQAKTEHELKRDPKANLGLHEPTEAGTHELKYPELDYPTVIQSSDDNLSLHNFASYQSDPCLESIIEEKLGVANPSQEEIALFSQTQDAFSGGDEIHTRHDRNEVKSIFDEEAPDVYTELSDDEFDAEAERKALISLLGASYASEVMDSRSESRIGPVLDVNAVTNGPKVSHRDRPSDGLTNPQVHQPTLAASHHVSHAKRQPQRRDVQQMTATGDYHLVDQPHQQASPSPLSTEEVNEMLRRLRAARGA